MKTVLRVDLVNPITKKCQWIKNQLLRYGGQSYFCYFFMLYSKKIKRPTRILTSRLKSIPKISSPTDTFIENIFYADGSFIRLIIFRNLDEAESGGKHRESLVSVPAVELHLFWVVFNNTLFN